MSHTQPPSLRPSGGPPPIRRPRNSLAIWLGLGAVAFLILLIILFWPDDDPEQKSTAANQSASSPSAFDSAPGETGGGDFGESGGDSKGNASVEPPASAGAGEADGSRGSGSGPAKFNAPAEALAEAQAQYGMAQNQLAQGNAGEATASVIEAWEIASQFPDDPACAEFAGKLLPEIQSLSKRANEKFQRQVERDETPLVEQ